MLQADLQDPDGKAMKIALLRGTASVTLRSREEEIIIDKVLSGEPQTKEAGGIKAVLRKCDRQGEQYSVELELSTDKKPLEWLWPESEQIRLEDAEGGGLTYVPKGMRNGTVYTLNYTGRPGGGAAEKLRFTVVTGTYSRKVYFEMKDIPIK